MTINELIKELERLDEKLLDGLDDWQDLTDYAKEHAHYAIEDAIQHLKENDD